MFILKSLIICVAWLAVSCRGQANVNTTPVPILKQINRQNDDGSYSFGYEAADGSFKIETKYPNGDVAGKYGYVDESGKTREISYGASSKRGFEPEGPGIQVPPPTLNNQPTNALTDGQEDDGQYREDPSIYEDPKYNRKTQPRPAPLTQYHEPTPTAAPQYQTQYKSSPRYTQTQQNLFDQSPQTFPSEDYRPQSQVYHQQPQFSYQGYTPQNNNNYQQQNYQQPQNYQQQQNYQPQNYQQSYQPQNYQQRNYQPQNYQDANPYSIHPALQNFDPNTGSYTINFTG